MKLKIREANNQDIPFIINSWLMSYRNLPQVKQIPNDVYFNDYANLVKVLLNSCMVVMAVDEKDHDHIYGFLAFKIIPVANGTSIFIGHYAYVKHTYRNLGVMKMLVNSVYPNFKKEQFITTHINQLLNSKRDKYQLVYNPFFREALHESFIN